MPVPQVYRKGNANILQNYDFVDIADGLGYIHYYGLDTKDNSATSYRLVKTPTYSYDVETTQTADTNYNFDSSTFNTPRIAKGTAFVRFQTLLSSVGGASVTYTVKVQKVATDGTTVTTLGSTTSETITRAGAGTTFTNLLIAVALTQTQIKNGETLRVRIEVDTSFGSGLDRSYFGIDPQNRSGTNITPSSTYATTLDSFIPFRIVL